MEATVYVDYSIERDDEGLDSMAFGMGAHIYEDDADERSEIGSACGYLYRIKDSEEGWRNAWYAADAVSGDLEYILSTVREAFEDEYCDKLFILDSITITDRKRSEGLGRKFMQQIIEDLTFLDTDVIVLTPGYYGEHISSEQNLNNAKLRGFYGRLGFTETQHDSGKAMVMEKWLA